ncbi:MAG: hypothetical protein JWO45_65 [Spartobacteria bacterium]|nr:hypothetical protein [Spartobacteria bacterium]
MANQYRTTTRCHPDPDPAAAGEGPHKESRVTQVTKGSPQGFCEVPRCARDDRVGAGCTTPGVLYLSAT